MTLCPISYKCVFLGCSRTKKRYKCYDPSSHQVLVSVDVIFFESTLYFSSKEEGLNIDILSGQIDVLSLYVES